MLYNAGDGRARGLLDGRDRLGVQLQPRAPHQLPGIPPRELRGGLQLHGSDAGLLLRRRFLLSLAPVFSRVMDLWWHLQIPQNHRKTSK